MGMKMAAATILRRFGFRTMLVVNALISAAFLAVCAAFTQATPVAVMVALLLVGGFFRSLQFTSINTIAYAEVEPARVSRATSLVSVGQQLAISAGVAFGALAVELTVRVQGQRRLAGGRFPAGFPGGGGDFGPFGADFRAAFARCRGGNGRPAARRRRKPPTSGSAEIVIMAC